MTNKTRHVMVDLETLGTGSNAPIIAIGAVKFGANGLGKTFYQVIEIQSSLAAGTADGSTIQWWMQQSEEARNAIFGKGIDTYPLVDVLKAFKGFLFELNAPPVRIWGCGASFDNVLLVNAYKALGLSVPWAFQHDRCYRTIKSIYPGVKMERVGTHHNALDDAESQATHLLDIVERYELELR